MNQSQIAKEAKQILDNFAKELEKISLKQKKQKKSLGGFREEQPIQSSEDKDFKKRMFANAPDKDDNFILAEKKKW